MLMFCIRSHNRNTCSLRAAALSLLWLAGACSAQELEPRRWNHLPTGIHVAGAGYAYTHATINFSPVLQIKDVDADIHTALAKYIQTFSVLGHSARIGVAQGYQHGRWSGDVGGEPTTIHRDGFTDSIIRFSVSLYGAPPMEGKEFAAYRAEKAKSETIMGAGLIVQLPTGEYYSNKLINLGSNRYTFRPQLGVLHSRGKFSMELTSSVWLYTDNDDFYGDTRLENDPLYVLQGHLTYSFRPGLWLGTGIGYGYGAESTLDGKNKGDKRKNLAWGGSISYPITRKVGTKLTYVGTKSQTSLGADTHTIALAASVLW
ncbi:transporter [Pontiella sulfatireligans]|nr:transporter [Pontiella sulfatireligans]